MPKKPTQNIGKKSTLTKKIRIPKLPQSEVAEKLQKGLKRTNGMSSQNNQKPMNLSTNRHL